MLYLQVYSRHHSYIVSGITLYCEAFGVALKHAGVPPAALRQHQQSLTFAEFEFTSGVVKKVCFDMGDWPEFASFKALDYCDMYVKRSYSESHLEVLPVMYKKKVTPYGLYFACSSNRLNQEVKVVWSVFINTLLFQRDNLLGKFREVMSMLFKVGIKRKPIYLPIDALESISGGNHFVFYHTRLWDPKLHRSHFGKTIKQLNNERIELVRALKNHLGERFRGGVMPSELASNLCPDLITPLESHESAYLKHLAAATVVVTEEGLHGSSGSRLGEYFAAGRCIVCEQPRFDTLKMPVNGIDWHLFQTPQECVELCEKLLKDDALVDKTMLNASTFYNENLKPLKTIQNIVAKLGID